MEQNKAISESVSCQGGEINMHHASRRMLWEDDSDSKRGGFAGGKWKAKTMRVWNLCTIYEREHRKVREHKDPWYKTQSIRIELEIKKNWTLSYFGCIPSLVRAREWFCKQCILSTCGTIKAHLHWNECWVAGHVDEQRRQGYVEEQVPIEQSFASTVDVFPEVSSGWVDFLWETFLKLQMLSIGNVLNWLKLGVDKVINEFM